MKRLLVLFCLLVFTGKLYGQLLPLHSQYMNNQYLINPAVSGTNDYTDLVMSYRSQWNGVAGAPEQLYLSANGYFDKRKPGVKDKFVKQGIGGVIYHESIGSFQRQFMMLSYAYHLPLEKMYLSMAISAGIQRQQLDFTRVNFLDRSDPFIAENQTNGDFTFSMMAYGPKFYFGISAFQLENYVGNFPGQSAQWVANAGYRWVINQAVEVAPSILVQYGENLPVTYDLNFKARYKESIWSGVSYRNSQALVAMIGFALSPALELNYSFDLAFNELEVNNWNAHELALRFKIRHRERCPSYFW